MAMLVVLLAKQLVDVAVLARVAALLPVFMLGAWLGAHSFDRSSEATYRRFAYVMLLCVALFGLVRQ